MYYVGQIEFRMFTLIRQLTFRIYFMVLEIHRHLLALPPQVEQNAPVTLIDAFGRRSPFHLEFVRSAEVRGPNLFIAFILPNLSAGSPRRFANQF